MSTNVTLDTREDSRPTVGVLLRATLEAFTNELHVRLARAGFGDIRQAHGAVFQHIGPTGSQVSEMARRAHMTKQAMAELVSYLEERGYVERASEPADRRARIVRLTDRGWEAVETARQTAAEIEESWASRLGSGGMSQLRSALDALITP